MRVFRCDFCHIDLFARLNLKECSGRIDFLNRIGSKPKELSRPTPLTYPSSSVETPVCGFVRRTPSACPPRSQVTPQRGIGRCAKTGLRMLSQIARAVGPAANRTLSASDLPSWRRSPRTVRPVYVRHRRRNDARPGIRHRPSCEPRRPRSRIPCSPPGFAPAKPPRELPRLYWRPMA